MHITLKDPNLTSLALSMLIKGSGTNSKQNNIKKHVIHSIKKSTTNKGLPTNSRHHIRDFEQFKALRRMLDFTLSALFPSIPEQYVVAHMDYILHLYSSKGPEYVVRYLKATYSTIEHILLKLPGMPKYEKVSIGLDKELWPKWLGNGLKSSCLVKKDPEIQRYVMTLCSIRYLLIIKTYTSLESITAAPTAFDDDIKSIVKSVEKDILLHKKFIRSPEIGSNNTTNEDSVVTTHETPSLEVSLKSGPNGVSLLTFPWDRAAIVKHSLYDQLLEYAESYYEGESDDWLDDKIDPYLSLVDSNRQLNVGKIALTSVGGKTKLRIFGILDTLTQSLLAPLHRDLMSILRKISEDCTFDHSKVVSTAKELHANGHDFYGYADLSNASDAIDKRLYAHVGNLWKENLGDSWVQLFDRPFVTNASVKQCWDTSKPFLKEVRYNTGQPMGALSSWPFMAYVHHVLVWRAFGGYEHSKGKYLLLGDDIVIFDRRAYTNYCKLLEKLGIPYTNNFSTVGFEFAKRTFCNGVEITGAYSSALWASRNNPELFSMEWRTLASRGYKSGNDLPPLFRKLLKVNRKRYEKCKLLMLIPYGTNPSVVDLAKFCNHVTGRSNCFLQVGERDNSVKAIESFRQGASFLIKQSFQKLLDDAKEALGHNAKAFTAYFTESYLKHYKVTKSSGLDDQQVQVMQKAINEYISNGTTRIRFLERDLKQSYLGSTQIMTNSQTGEEEMSYIPPSDKVLLRPSLPQIPRFINFTERDNHMVKLKFRAEHQLNIVKLLRG